MTFFNSLWAFIVAIGLLVVIHELGHYLVMRWCGVRVLRFAFGFGKTLWSRTDKSGTEWAICLWPLGGYVKPLDTRDTDHVSQADRAQAFDTQTVGKRIAMVSAGPLANFLLAILLYWIVFMSGVTEWRPILAAPDNATPAAQAGVRSGDLVTRVDGDPVSTWAQAQWEIMQTLSRDAEVLLAVVQTSQGVPVAGAQDRGISLRVPSDTSLGPDTLSKLGLRLAVPQLPPVVGQVQKDSAAQRAGLQSGDVIQQAAGQPVSDWSSFVKIVRSHPEQVVQVVVMRQNQSLTLDLKPQSIEEQGTRIGRAGVSPDQGDALAAYRIQRALDPFAAFGADDTQP